MYHPEAGSTKEVSLLISIAYLNASSSVLMYEFFFEIFLSNLSLAICGSFLAYSTMTVLLYCSLELYTGDEIDCRFATEKLTGHVQWQEIGEIVQLKIICAHNSHNNGHAVDVMTFNWDRLKISLAFVFIVAFYTRHFYGKEKIVKHTDL